MLSLSFPRGFAVLVFVLPTYRRRRPRRPRPPLACPPLDRNLRSDADKLLGAGHATAAAMTARVEMERLLTRAAMHFPDYGNEWCGIQETAQWLRKRRVMRLRTLRRVIVSAATGNAAAHGKPVEPAAVQEMLQTIDGLRDMVGRLTPKGGAR
jgi:hypothetical protein